MVKIRPRRPSSENAGAAGARGGPAHAEGGQGRWHDDDALQGAAAFGPTDDPDPFARAFDEERRPGRNRPGGAARTALAAAALVLLAGILAVLLGFADDDEEGDDDLATAVSTSSSSTSLPRLTTTSSATTSTTVATSTTVSSVTSTTTQAATGTTAGPATTIGPGTTLPTATTLPANRPLTITIGVPNAPVAGTPTRVVVTLSDPDAMPTSNCFVVEVVGPDGNEVTVVRDPCDDAPCTAPDNPGIQPAGATRTVELDITLTAGDNTITASGRSGDPECANQYADTATAERVVTVAPAPAGG